MLDMMLNISISLYPFYVSPHLDVLHVIIHDLGTDLDPEFV